MTFTFKATPAPKPTTFGDLLDGTAFRNMFGSAPGSDVFLKVASCGATTGSSQSANTVRLTGTPAIFHSGAREPVVVVHLECKEVQA